METPNPVRALMQSPHRWLIGLFFSCHQEPYMVKAIVTKYRDHPRAKMRHCIQKRSYGR